MIMNFLIYFIFAVFFTLFLDKINVLEDLIGEIKTKNVLFFLLIYPLIVMVHLILFLLLQTSLFFESFSRKNK